MGRVTATVLFTDLVGSTELRARLGEDAAEDLRRQQDRLLTEAVVSHDGRVVKGLGDGIMATFSGASDAVAAAVAIQQAVDRLNRSGKAPVPLAVRVGLSAGDVTFEDDDVHGTPVIEAARLCAAADGGGILVADVVRALAGLADGEVDDRGRLELKGLHRPVAAWAVPWEPVAATTIPLPPLLTDVGRIFVGRDAELDRLTQLWKEAAAGERRTVLLGGEPGIGKTRLAAELAGRAHQAGGVVLAGRCDEDLGVPYQPFVEALRHFVTQSPSGELGRRLGRYGGELTRLVPELAPLVGGLPPPVSSDPETERYRLFDAVAGWISAASADEPMLLVLDDLQWAAKPTLLMLRHVIGSAEPMKALIFATYRDGEAPASDLTAVLADLRRHESVERLSLVGLDDAGVAAFVAQAAGHTLGEHDAVLARAIFEETDGNPFFVREVVRHLRETGVVGGGEGQWSGRRPIDEIGIPAGVREVVAQRLSRLSGPANGVLRTASVVGVEFEPALLGATGEFTEGQVIAGLEEAAGARLVLESGRGRYRFAHALVRATVYDSLSAVRREATHHRLAETLERLHGDNPGPRVAELARHWMASTDPAAAGKAVDYAALAGQTALDRLAPEEAIRWFSQAIERASHSAPGGETDDPDLLIGLGRAQLFAGEPAHRETLLRAAHLARAAGDADRLVRAALANSRGTHSRSGDVDAEKIDVLEAALAVTTGDTAERAVLLAMLAVELAFAGDWNRRRGLADEARAMARRLDDPVTFVAVANLTYLAVAVPETLPERLAVTAEALALAAELQDPSAYDFACVFRCYACADAGDLAGFDSYLAEMTGAAEVAGDPSRQWVAGFVRAGRTLLAGGVTAAETAATDAFTIGSASGQPDALPIFVGGLIEIRRHQGRLAEVEDVVAAAADQHPGLPVLRAKLAGLSCELGRCDAARTMLDADVGNGFADFGYDPTWLHAMTTYAEVAARLDHRRAAQELYERLVPWHDQVAFLYYATNGAVAHYLGMLATTRNDDGAAQTHFGEAMQIHLALRAPYWIASTQLESARMLLRRNVPGDADEARHLIAEAVATAGEYGFVNLERHAAALRPGGV